MADLITMLSAVAGQQGEEVDEDFNQTVLLLHGDGTNGAQNNTFLDSSSNNFTITRNGNTTQGTFSPFSLSDGYWSNFFDGTNDRLTIADNAVLRPGTGNFTIEAWVYRAAAGAAHTIFAKGASTPTGFAFGITSSNTLRFTDTSSNIDSTGTVAANTWVHVAVVREGTGANQLKLYINGVQDGQGTVSTNFNQTEEARIGENRGATDDFNGYISNFRYVVGSAIYTAGFTPSTSPLTTTSQGAVSSEVELLTCQSNRFVDNSTNGFTVTPVNNTRVTPFSPFAPTAAYSAGTNGGSGYFDGSGGTTANTDKLTIANNAAFQFGSGDFTIECWVYLTATPTTACRILDKEAVGQDEFLVAILSATNLIFGYSTTGSGITSVNFTGVFTVGQWTHLVITRSGSTLEVFQNGTSLGTSTLTATIRAGTASLYIGNAYFDERTFPGYISGLKIIKGTAVNPSGVPTSPPVDSSGTSLLCNFTNAGILDQTGKNNLETVGNAQIDTAVKKYGTGSMKFDGTGDALHIVSTPDLYLSRGNFTIEGWVYTANSSVNQTVFLRRSAAQARGMLCLINSFVSQKLSFRAGASDEVSWEIELDSTTSLANNTWYHFAIVRDGDDFELFINGVSEDTANNSVVIADDTSLFRIGLNDAGSSGLNGYIDDLRITKGVARYTANFTAPTKAFPDQ